MIQYTITLYLWRLLQKIMKAKTSPKVISTIGVVFGLTLLMSLSLTVYIYSFAQKNNISVKDTFEISGPIVYLVDVPSNNISKTANVTGQLDSMNKFVLSGNWSISAKKGEITNFKVSFIKVLADGNKRHTHDLINFKQDNNTKAQLTADNSSLVKGLVDVKLNNNIPWNNTNVDIGIAKGKDNRH